jgi:hypothetical protein
MLARTVGNMSTDFTKPTSVKFDENLFSGPRVLTSICMTKLIKRVFVTSLQCPLQTVRKEEAMSASRNSPEGIEENHERPQQEGRDSNRAAPKYNPT